MEGFCQKAYITNNYTDNVSVINIQTNGVIATVPVGSQPYGVAVSPDGTRAYIANGGSDNVSVINTITNTVVTTIPVGNGPMGLCVSPDGSSVYVANQNNNTVSVINTSSNTMVATIAVGSMPWSVCITPDGAKVYVVNYGFVAFGCKVTVINTATNSVSDTITVGFYHRGSCISPDGSKAYIPENSNEIYVIDTAVDTVSAIITLPNPPIAINAITISPDGSRAYVTDQAGHKVHVVNLISNSLITTIPVGTNPIGISISPDGSKVFVANHDDDNVSVINTATNTVSATISVGMGPMAFGNFITGHTTGLASQDQVPEFFQLYPNPSSSGFSIRFMQVQQNSHIEISDVTGRVIYNNASFSGSGLEIGNELICSGIYTVSVIDENKRKQTQKLVIE
jgi:YVTN family beta-propeller protein